MMRRCLVMQTSVLGRQMLGKSPSSVQQMPSSTHVFASFVGGTRPNPFSSSSSVKRWSSKTLVVQHCGSTSVQISLPCRSLWPRRTLLVSEDGANLTPLRTMAGHSKWHNIRHVKGIKDAEKAKVNSTFSKRITACVRETGTTDPKFNIQLARLITEAKAKDVSNATIEAAIRQGMLDKQSSTREYFDVKGPGGLMLILEAVTARRELTKNNLKNVFKKHGFSVESSGALRHFFTSQGLILVACQEKPDLDAFVEVAIDVGAEDVTLDENEDGETLLRFTCEPNNIHAVKKALEDKKLPVQSQEVTFLPTMPVVPSEDLLETLGKVMDKMEEAVPEVVNVFTNIGKDT